MWLASAFRDYERIVALENAFRKRSKGELTPEDRDALAVALYAARAEYNLGARTRPEATLNDTRSDLRQDDWYRVASGKGVLLLHDLRNYLGAEKFAALMEKFGADHGGKPTGVGDFREAVLAVPGVDAAAVRDLLDCWTVKPGLPRYKLGKVSAERASGDKYTLTLALHVEGCACDRPVDVTVETEHGEVVKTVTAPSSPDGKVRIDVDGKPLRVVVDKYNLAAKADGGAFTVLTFKEEPEETLIVRGTADEANVNKEAAEALQQAIRASHCNITVPIKTDREVTDDDLKTHHLLLIGRPGCNALHGAVRRPAADLVRPAVVRRPRRDLRARRQRGAGGGGEPVEPALFPGRDRGAERRLDVAGGAADAGQGVGGGRRAAARQAGAGADGPGEVTLSLTCRRRAARPRNDE